MAAIVCEATGRAEEMGGLFVKGWGKKGQRGRERERERERERGRKGEGRHVKAGSVLTESHVLGPGV